MGWMPTVGLVARGMLIAVVMAVPTVTNAQELTLSC
jgi:hypothetical protein